MAAQRSVESYSDIIHRNNLTDQLQYVRRLDSNLRDSLNWYTREGNAQLLNSALRYRRTLTTILQTHFNNLTEIFKYVPLSRTSIEVYRGINNKDNVTTSFSTRTYLSTSLLKNIAIQFTSEHGHGNCCMLKINVNPNSRIIPIPPEISAHPSEFEILLDRDFNFILTHIHQELDDGKEYFDISYSNGILISTSSQLLQISNVTSEELNKKQFISDFLKSFNIITLIKFDTSSKDSDDFKKNLKKIINKFNSNKKYNLNSELLDEVYNEILKNKDIMNALDDKFK